MQLCIIGFQDFLCVGQLKLALQKSPILQISKTVKVGEYNLTFAPPPQGGGERNQLRKENSKFIRKGREKKKEKMKMKEKGEETKKGEKRKRKTITEQEGKGSKK